MRISLPPDWWTVPLDRDTDPTPLIDAHLAAEVPGADQAPLRAALRPEWIAMTGAVRAMGARLFAGGHAPDPATGRNVVASLLVVHRPPDTALRPADVPLVAAELARAALRDGAAAADVVDLPAGPAGRSVTISEAGLPDEASIMLLSTEFVIPTERSGTWVLTFTTPSLQHAEGLGEVFDVVASTVVLPAA